MASPIAAIATRPNCHVLNMNIKIMSIGARKKAAMAGRMPQLRNA